MTRDEVNELHERIAIALRWPVYEVKSFSWPTLRDLVRAEHPKLAAEITNAIARGRYIYG